MVYVKIAKNQKIIIKFFGLHPLAKKKLQSKHIYSK